MIFNPDQPKQTKEVTFLSKTNQISYPRLYFNIEIVKLLHTQKRLGLQPSLAWWLLRKF